MFRRIMSSIREDLKLIFDESVNAVKPHSLVKNFIEIKENQLIIKNYSQNLEKCFSLQNTDIYILGAGKAVLKMCEQFLNQFDAFANNLENPQKPSIKKGLLSVPIGSTTKSKLFSKYNVKYRMGALHNMPDMDSLNTTQEIVSLIEGLKSCQTLKRNPLIICFISGGGSALLTLPKPGITLQQKCWLISELVKSGATIDQLNAVRQCVSAVKSGKLANLAISSPNPLPMVSFLISDIINDPIDLIASGPTVITRKESSKPSEKALKILKDMNIPITHQIKSIILSEDKQLMSWDSSNLLNNIIIGNNSIALKVAQKTAQQLGYKVIFLGNDIRGEASLIARDWAQIAVGYNVSEDELDKFKGICWIGGGETTVTMTNSQIGLGGRCQEMGLSFYRSVDTNCKEKLYLLAAGTDGQDGPTDVAGVIIENVSDNQVWNQSESYLKGHNSYQFFKRYYSDWFVKTGITGTNVMDIYCLIKSFHKN